MPQDQTFGLQESLASSPEGTPKRYRTFWRRLWASMIDGLVFLPIALADNHFLSADRASLTVVAWATFSYSAYWAYSVIFHSQFGQTLGKMAARVEVLDELEERIPTVKQALLRDLPHIVVSVASLGYLYVLVATGSYSPKAELEGPGRIVGMASFVWLVLELVTMLTNEKRRALHDLLARTVVVSAPREQTRESPFKER